MLVGEKTDFGCTDSKCIQKHFSKVFFGEGAKQKTKRRSSKPNSRTFVRLLPLWVAQTKIVVSKSLGYSKVLIKRRGPNDA